MDGGSQEHMLDVKQVINDQHVSGRFGFVLHDEEGVEVFSSGLVYSSESDAEQAGDDACMTALYWCDDNYLELGT